MVDPRETSEAKRERQSQAREADAAGKEKPGIDEHEAGGAGLSG